MEVKVGELDDKIYSAWQKEEEEEMELQYDTSSMYCYICFANQLYFSGSTSIVPITSTLKGQTSKNPSRSLPVRQVKTSLPLKSLLRATTTTTTFASFSFLTATTKSRIVQGYTEHKLPKQLPNYNTDRSTQQGISNDGVLVRIYS